MHALTVGQGFNNHIDRVSGIEQPNSEVLKLGVVPTSAST